MTRTPKRNVLCGYGPHIARHINYLTCSYSFPNFINNCLRKYTPSRVLFDACALSTYEDSVLERWGNVKRLPVRIILIRSKRHNWKKINYKFCLLQIHNQIDYHWRSQLYFFNNIFILTSPALFYVTSNSFTFRLHNCRLFAVLRAPR